MTGSLLLGAAVAIILSTGNTFLMIPSTNITRDIYHRFIRPGAGDREIVTWLALRLEDRSRLEDLIQTNGVEIVVPQQWPTALGRAS